MPAVVFLAAGQVGSLAGAPLNVCVWLSWKPGKMAALCVEQVLTCTHLRLCSVLHVHTFFPCDERSNVHRAKRKCFLLTVLIPVGLSLQLLVCLISLCDQCDQ